MASTRLKHQFIANIYYVFQTVDKIYYVSEYCMGGDLMTQNLIKENKFSERKARFYLCEIIIALDYIHSNNMVFKLN